MAGAEAEPGHQPEAEAREGGEGDDRRGGMHPEAGEGRGRASRGSRPRASGSGSRSGARMSMSRSRGRQVLVDRAGALLGHQVEAAAVGDEAGDRAVGVGEIAEVARAGRAGADAGGDAVDLGKFSVFNAIDAEGAFLHHALGRVHLAGAVGAGPGAEAAADAVVLVDQDDAVLGALEAGAGGADGDARGVGAVQAGLREVDDPGRAGVGDRLEAVDAVEKGAFGIGAVGVAVGERARRRRRCSIPCRRRRRRGSRRRCRGR